MAQTLFAAIAYVLIVIASFDNELGDPTTALQIASGSLWIWLVRKITTYAPTSFVDVFLDTSDLGMDKCRHSIPRK